MNRRQFIKKTTLGIFWGLIGLKVRSPCPAWAAPPPGCPGPKVALIIDDIGFSRERAESFLRIGIPLTFSVLPRLALSRELAHEIHGCGREVMLHQPMEPFNSCLDPGPGAVYVADAPERIEGVLRENISDLPFAVGVNNHMGSRFTSSPEKMTQVLPLFRDEGFFFVDSLTTGKSAAFATACRLHMPAAARNVFIDHRREESEILRSLEKLVHHARRHGRAVGIGHPYPETCLALERFVRSGRWRACEWVRVSEILGAPPV